MTNEATQTQTALVADEMPAEIFFPVPGLPPYKVGNRATVLGHTVNPVTPQYCYDGDILYPFVYLSNGKQHRFRLDRLVLAAHTSELSPEGVHLHIAGESAMDVLHLDGDPLNCAQSNLLWADKAEAAKRVLPKYKRRVLGEKLKAEALKMIGKGWAYHLIAKTLRIATHEVSEIARRKGLNARQLAQVRNGDALPREPRSEKAKAVREIIEREGRRNILMAFDTAQRIEVTNDGLTAYFNGEPVHALAAFNGGRQHFIGMAFREAFGLAHDVPVRIAGVALNPRPEAEKKLRPNGEMMSDAEWSKWLDDRKGVVQPKAAQSPVAASEVPEPTTTLPEPVITQPDPPSAPASEPQGELATQYLIRDAIVEGNPDKLAAIFEYEPEAFSLVRRRERVTLDDFLDLVGKATIDKSRSRPGCYIVTVAVAPKQYATLVGTPADLIEAYEVAKEAIS